MSQSLRLFSDTLEEWLECQKKWLYLENIFMAPDIQRQLPNETQLFGTVDRQFKSILRITRDRPAALPVCELDCIIMSSKPFQSLVSPMWRRNGVSCIPMQSCARRHVTLIAAKLCLGLLLLL